MPIFSAQRISDGLLSVITDVPSIPTNLIDRAIAGDSGAPEDWQIITLSQQQYSDALLASPGRAYLSDGSVTPKALALTSSDAQITADGVDSATLTANTGDASYTGNVRFTVTAPDGTILTEDVVAVAGVATTTMMTTQVDNHTVKAESIEFGSDEITVEGI